MSALDGAAFPKHPGPAGEPSFLRSKEFQDYLKPAQDEAKKHPETKPEILNPDVLVVGSGPIGAVFARKLVAEGKSVLMIDMGEQATQRVGDHKKNSVAIQKDISRFTNIVKGELQPLSVPTNFALPTLEPTSWGATTSMIKSLQNGQNPNQDPWDNLVAAAASRVVGGMGSHWTCCTPRQHPELERSNLFTSEEWDDLYSCAENLFRTNSTSFEKSVRQQLVKRVLRAAYKDAKREILSMPLACQRSQANQNYVEWTSSATILGELSEPSYNGDLFKIRSSTQLLKLARADEAPGRVVFAVARDLLKDKDFYIVAKKYVICAGAVLTPGILFKSGIRTDQLPALGRYMTEQTMSFCQVVLKRSLVDEAVPNLKANPVLDADLKYDLADWVEKHQENQPLDPIPFPFNDPDPQCYFPLSEKYPWHTQIHRDAFGYGEVPPNIDQRLVVDFRWFGYTEPAENNWVEFSDDVTDAFGMPQPTFHFRPNDQDAERCQRMITDMVEVARNLGGFLPGAEPKYLPPGSALHICGTYRAGTSKEDSVVSREGKVWGIENLVLGGCGAIPTQNACNPTLTAACFALAAARQIVEELK